MTFENVIHNIDLILNSKIRHDETLDCDRLSSYDFEWLQLAKNELEKRDKYRWHNLLNNPYDLPNDNDFKKDYVIIFDNNNKCVSRFYGRGESCQGYYEYPKGVWEAHQYYECEVIAWKEIEEFDEVSL